MTEDISVYERSCGAGEGAIAMAADMVEDLFKVLGRIHCNALCGQARNGTRSFFGLHALAEDFPGSWEVGLLVFTSTD